MSPQNSLYIVGHETYPHEEDGELGVESCNIEKSVDIF
jgi:hypothetical protein